MLPLLFGLLCAVRPGAYSWFLYRRWLTHSISDYYGLDSKSVEMGTPAKKVVYIGIKQLQLPRRELPRPLWEMF